MNLFLDIGKRLRELRGHYSQRKFAKLMGISFWTYATYEKGLRPPSFELLKNLKERLYANIDWILTGKSETDDWMRVAQAATYSRTAILQRYGNLCVYCRSGVETILLIRPMSPPMRTKKTSYDDLIVLCPNCEALFKNGYISIVSMRAARAHALKSATAVLRRSRHESGSQS